MVKVHELVKAGSSPADLQIQMPDASFVKRLLLKVSSSLIPQVCQFHLEKMEKDRFCLHPKLSADDIQGVEQWRETTFGCRGVEQRKGRTMSLLRQYG